MQLEATKAIRSVLTSRNSQWFIVVMLGIRYLLYVICSASPAGDVAAVEIYGEEMHRLLMICSRNQDDDDEGEADVVAVAVNNLAYICRDLGTERFAPFFQGCIEVMANLLSNIPPSDQGCDDSVSMKILEAVSDAIEVLAAVYTSAFLPALSLLLPPVTALASPTSSGKRLQTQNLKAKPKTPFLHDMTLPPCHQKPSPPPPSASSPPLSRPSVQVPRATHA